MEKRPLVVPVPAAVRQYAEDGRALYRASLESNFEGIPHRDLDRLKDQLTPLLSRPGVYPDDRDTITRLMQEWQMRGHSVPAFNSMYDVLKADRRAEREAKAAPRRRYLRERYPEMYAPLNPGLSIVGRPSPTLADRASAWLRGGTPDRPAPTFTDKLRRALHS